MTEEKKNSEINSNLYLTDSKGDPILNKDGSPRKKSGRPKGSKSAYHFTKQNQQKITARQALKRKRNTVEKLEKKLRSKKQTLKQQETTVKKFESASDEQTVSKQGKVVTEEEVSSLPDSVQQHLDATNSFVAFMPNEGPQTDFLAAPEKDVLYGGAAGGGKSFAMLIDPLRNCHLKGHRALILRRSMPELRELIDKSRELYPRAFPGTKFREVEKIWNFPSGAKIEFGFLEKDADVYRYQGQAYSWIGFDEITHLPTEFGWNYLASRLRTTDPKIKTYLRCTANPGGVGAHWVRKRYLEPTEPNKSFIGDDGLTRKFIPARLMDNPYLAQDGEYERMLLSLPPIQRKQLLEGNWEVNEGAAFVEFDPSVHVVTPFELPLHWERVKGIDYGYASESCCLWAAVDPQDKTLIIYRELYQKGLTGEALGTQITTREQDEYRSVPGVLDTSAWARTGYTGPTIGEALIKAGHKLRRADKNRIAGKVQIHEHLKQATTESRPRLQIFNTCPNLIKELQNIPLSKTNPEDVDTHAQDHAYDALRYLIMSRPRMTDPIADMMRLKQRTFEASDSTFGY